MPIVKVTDVRVAFPDFWKPDEKYNRFGCAFPIEPGSANAKLLEAAQKEAAVGRWGEKAGAILDDLKGKGRVAYRQAPLSKEGEVYDGFVGMHHISPTNEARVPIIDKDTTPLGPQDGRPYAGCYVDASIEIWAQDNSWGKRINAKLRWVQFRRNGDAFSGGAPVSPDEFQSIAEGATADDMV